MGSPFEMLGLTASASAEDVRNAYRQKVKTCHPDKFQGTEEQQRAQEEMIRLNLAYEAALKLAASRQSVASYRQELPAEEALALAAKMLRRKAPESALRHLLRSSMRDAAWYAMQGHILMAMDQYESAHQSYREAVRRVPDNNEYRRGALEAAVALKKSRTVSGRIRLMLKKMHKR